MRNTNVPKNKLLTPQEAAIDCIRTIISKSEHVLPVISTGQKVEKAKYSAHVEQKKVIVTVINGNKIKEEFPMKGILITVINEEFKKHNSPKKIKRAYKYEQQEISQLISIILTKLKKHKKRFLKTHPKNYDCVHDLRIIANVLKQLI